MSAASPVIRISGLGKRYRIGETARYRTLRETCRGWFARPRQEADTREFWALRDVSLDVGEGEVVGIIGRNGAGKSTLLRILARITHPSTGGVDIRGRVGSLLEVGTGFHPELTGRENIFLNGAILGMSRREMQHKLDAIVDFAEIERFLDTPVKRYSSGMYVRLAFAVAAHLEPDVLLVDEVLAVGDLAFQRKCLDKLQEAASSRRTVLFVSHNMAAVNGLCTRAVLIDDGVVVGDGPPHEITASYFGRLSGSAESPGSVRVNRGLLAAQADGDLRIDDLRVANPGSPHDGPRTGDPLRITIAYTARRRFAAPAFVVSLRDHLGLEVIRLSTRPISGFDLGGLHNRGEVSLEIEHLPLVGGRFFIDLGFVRESVEWLFNLEAIAEFDVAGADVYGSGFVLDRSRGMVVAAHRWTHTAHE